MHLFYSREISGQSIVLDEEETYHCNRVLRLIQGDIVGVLDGQGNLYECRISGPGKKQNTLTIIRVDSREPDPYYIHLAIAPTKNTDRMEWMAEKATELGIHEISFLACAHSERITINPDRLSRKMISALKQSMNTYLPVVNPVRKFGDFVDSQAFTGQRFIATISDPPSTFLSSEATAAGRYLVMIGPEGDFTDGEVDLAIRNSFVPVSLGKSRLRTETAALAALHTLIIINQASKK